MEQAFKRGEGYKWGGREGQKRGGHHFYSMLSCTCNTSEKLTAWCSSRGMQGGLKEGLLQKV